MKNLSNSNLAKSNNGAAYQKAIKAFESLAAKGKMRAIQHNTVLSISASEVTLVEAEGLTNRESVHLYALFFEGVMLFVEQFSIGTTHTIRPLKSFEPYLKPLSEIQGNMLKNRLIDINKTDAPGKPLCFTVGNKSYIQYTNTAGLIYDIYGNDTHYINHVRFLEMQRNGEPVTDSILRRYADGVHEAGCTCDSCHDSRMAPYRLTVYDLPILN